MNKIGARVASSASTAYRRVLAGCGVLIIAGRNNAISAKLPMIIGIIFIAVIVMVSNIIGRVAVAASHTKGRILTG